MEKPDKIEFQDYATAKPDLYRKEKQEMTESGKKDRFAGKPGGHHPYLSMWALLGKCSFYKILAVLLVMVSAEGVLFYLSMERMNINVSCGTESPYSAESAYSSEFRNSAEFSYGKEAWYNLESRYSRTSWYNEDGVTLYQLFENMRIFWVFIAALGLVFFILVWTESRLDYGSGSTMLRLRVTQKEFFLIKVFYNVFCLIFVFTVQVWTAFGMLWIFRREAGGDRTVQQLFFFAFYGISFLHCLLPMAEAGKWVRNILLLFAFGMEAASVRTKKAAMPISMFCVSVNWFVSDMGVNVLDVLCYVLYGGVMMKGIWYFCAKLKGGVD